MNESNIKVRLMQSEDFDAVVAIDEKILRALRRKYYQMKFDKFFEFIDHLTSVDVRKISTLIDWNDSKRIHFMSENQFSPAKTINLERSL